MRRLLATRREGGRQRVVADVHDAQPAEALEERQGEDRRDLGEDGDRRAYFCPGLCVNDSTVTDF